MLKKFTEWLGRKLEQFNFSVRQLDELEERNAEAARRLQWLKARSKDGLDEDVLYREIAALETDMDEVRQSGRALAERHRVTLLVVPWIRHLSSLPEKWFKLLGWVALSAVVYAGAEIADHSLLSVSYYVSLVCLWFWLVGQASRLAVMLSRQIEVLTFAELSGGSRVAVVLVASMMLVAVHGVISAVIPVLAAQAIGS